MLFLATVFLAASTVLAKSASNFPISSELAAQHGCDATCQKSLGKTNAKDLALFDLPFDFDFYETATNFSKSKPGDLLKLAPMNPNVMKIPAGVALYRIQYTSTETDNSTVPATAFIAFPFARQQKPFGLVAYAHGTTGVFRGCAPSTSSRLNDDNNIRPLLLSGYAVVATDYVGLGNNYTSHKYIASHANANDVYWSVVAAKKAFPKALSNDWVSLGHSQGGGASWKLSEHELVQSESSGYLGGVAIAPVTYLYDAMLAAFAKAQESDVQAGDLGATSIVPSIFFGLRAVFGKNFTAPFLTKKMMNLITLGEKAQLCDFALSGLTKGLNTSEIFQDMNPDSFAPVKKFQELNSPAQGVKTVKPLLLIQGSNDSTTFPELTEVAYNNSCNAGNSVHLSLYPELDHSATIGASAPQWLGFIDQLFQGKGLCGCSKETVDPFDVKNAHKPLDADL